MKSIGFSNTSNEATELIRLQRQTLEDKLKADKEKKIKADENADKDGGLVPYNSLQNRGGSNNMTQVYDDNFQNINHTINTILYNMPG